MIFYFSGTGNSRWAAMQLGEKTGDRVYDISSLKEIPDIRKEGQIGFIFPVYAWGVPEPMLDFAGKLDRTDAFTFGVCTCGADAGLALKKLSGIYPLDSCYSLVMPNNYMIGSDVEDEQVILKKISRARRKLDVISEEITARKKIYRVHEGSMPVLKSNLVNMGFNKFARSTKPFFVTDLCNGCGLCAKNCPASAIEMDGEKPAWNKSRCFQCLRCMNECPKSAIEYGKATSGRGRYTIQKYVKY